MPVHMIHLRDMGLVQGQNLHLDDLAADCAADGQYDFLLVATPLPLTGAVGAPVAPTASSRSGSQPKYSPPLTSRVWPVMTLRPRRDEEHDRVRDVVLGRDAAERDVRLDLAAHFVARDAARLATPSR